MKVLGALALVVLWADPAPPSPAPEVDAVVAPRPRLAVVRLDVDEQLRAPLTEALSLRLEASIEAFGDHTPGRGDEGQAYVRIRGPDHETYAIAIILSDGRAYDRQVVAPPSMAGRILGSELALLLRGIDEGTLVPDRQDAVIPPPDPEPAPVEPVQEGPPESVPSTDEGSSSHRPAPPRSLLELGLRADAGGLLGIVPAVDIGASAAGAGGLGLDLRWPGGAVLSADLRVGGRRVAPYSVIRTRIALGGGLVARRGAFELPVVAQLAIEPWGVRAQGRGTTVHPIDGAARQVPLVGVVVRASPGARLSVAGRPSSMVRIGPYVELSGSAVFSDGVGVPRLRDVGTGAVVARMGGLELAAGLSLQLWLELEAGASRSRSTP